MAAYAFREGTEERKMIIDFWNMIQEHWIPEDKDEYWKGVIDATDSFVAENHNQPLAIGMALAFITYLEDKMEDMNEVNKDNEHVNASDGIDSSNGY